MHRAPRPTSCSVPSQPRELAATSTDTYSPTLNLPRAPPGTHRAQWDLVAPIWASLSGIERSCSMGMDANAAAIPCMCVKCGHVGLMGTHVAPLSSCEVSHRMRLHHGEPQAAGSDRCACRPLPASAGESHHDQLIAFPSFDASTTQPCHGGASRRCCSLWGTRKRSGFWCGSVKRRPFPNLRQGRRCARGLWRLLVLWGRGFGLGTHRRIACGGRRFPGRVDERSARCRHQRTFAGASAVCVARRGVPRSRGRGGSRERAPRLVPCRRVGSSDLS